MTNPEQALSEKLSAAWNLEIPNGKTYEVRYSTQPYCPRAHYFAVQNDGCGSDSMASECITEAGNALHRLLQKRIFAQNCESLTLCGRLDENGEYEEFSFDGDIPGHSDGLLRMSGKYYVLEIKTVMREALQWLREPRQVHLVQAQCYAKEFSKLGYSMEGVLMVYVDREVLTDMDSEQLNFKVFFKPFDPTVQENYAALVIYGKQCIELGHTPEGICGAGPSNAEYCPFVEQCFAYSNPMLNSSEEIIALAGSIYSKAQPVIPRGLPKYARRG